MTGPHGVVGTRVISESYGFSEQGWLTILG